MLRSDLVQGEPVRAGVIQGADADRPEDPRTRLRLQDGPLDRGQDVVPRRIGEGATLPQVEPEPLGPGAGVGVGVVEAGDHYPPLKVDHLRGLAGQDLDLGGGTNRRDPPTADRHGLRPGTIRVGGKHACVGEDEIGSGLGRHCSRRDGEK